MPLARPSPPQEPRAAAGAGLARGAAASQRTRGAGREGALPAIGCSSCQSPRSASAWSAPRALPTRPRPAGSQVPPPPPAAPPARTRCHGRGGGAGGAVGGALQPGTLSARRSHVPRDGRARTRLPAQVGAVGRGQGRGPCQPPRAPGVRAAACSPPGPGGGRRLPADRRGREGTRSCVL